MLHIIHTADWHLGHHLHGISRAYEHRQFLVWLLEQLQQKQVDVLIVAGDIFDTANPSALAQTQLYDFLVKARQLCPLLDIILIGGNHDSAARLDAPASLFHALGIFVVGGLTRNHQGDIEWQRLLIPLKNKDGEIKAWCGAMPFLRHIDLPNNDSDEPLITGVKSLYAELWVQLKQQVIQDEALLLTGHCYMVGGCLSELSERKILGGNQHALPSDIFTDEVSYIALGHLHLAQTVRHNEHIRYSGSPIPLSFDEQHYQHQVLDVMIDVDKHVSIQPLFIPRYVAILRLPNAQSFGELSTVLEQLEAYPFNDELPLEQQPLLELRITLAKPEPSLRQQIETCIAELPVRLLKISTAYAGNQQDLTKVTEEQRLEDLQPEHVFKQCYRHEFGTDAPVEMIGLFHELHENLQQVESCES